MALGGEVGVFTYLGPSVEARGGLKGLIGTGAKDWFAGVDFGLRAQSPSRLAPFAGVGSYLGGNTKTVAATSDGIDNDADFFVDEAGETKDDSNFLASIYPETGVHFWLNSATRLTASAQYHVTTEGRDADFWFFGFSLSFLNEAERRDSLEE